MHTLLRCWTKHSWKLNSFLIWIHACIHKYLNISWHIPTYIHIYKWMRSRVLSTCVALDWLAADSRRNSVQESTNDNLQTAAATTAIAINMYINNQQVQPTLMLLLELFISCVGKKDDNNTLSSTYAPLHGRWQQQ